jgi:LAO/AO transport system kinase
MLQRKNRLTVNQYVDGILQKDRVVLSRAITLVESSLSEDQLLAEEVLHQVLPYAANSLRIGITGVPGVGKSTFIEAFGQHIVQQGHQLAVLTIDPSSQASKGSILGDKTRMSALASDKRAFIRPSPSGNTLGGVAAKTREAMLLCEAAGFDVIFIETVGVGQSETLVKGMVDFFLLLMLAGAGDELQGIKKGIIETADALVITKADGDNLAKAKLARKDYQNALHLFPLNENGWKPKVKVCSAVENSGLVEVWEMMIDFAEKMKANGHFQRNRTQQRLAWMHEHIKWSLENRFYQDPAIVEQLNQVSPLVEKGEVPALTMARKLVQGFLRA